MKISALGPWHMDIPLRDGVSTGRLDVNSDPDTAPALRDPAKALKRWVEPIYPGGLKGRSFLDIACNAGGNSFAAKDLGAGKTLGFDVREHWIKQAEFVRKYRSADSAGMKFQVLDLYDFPDQVGQQWDISWFSGIFYHLPDPVRGLKIIADATNELLFISTATSVLVDPEPEKGCLHASYEGTEAVMTGVYGLNWLPSGPNLMRHILTWMGFPHVRVLSWRKRIQDKRRGDGEDAVMGRLSLVAARDPQLLSQVKDEVPVEFVRRDIAANRRATTAAE